MDIYTFLPFIVSIIFNFILLYEKERYKEIIKSLMDEKKEGAIMNDQDLIKIKQALINDFNNLYQKEYCTDYKEKRLVRGIEIEIMELNNLIAIIENLR